MRKVTEAKRLLDRIETYDDITRFEMNNADIMFNEELENASSDNEPYLMADKIDAKKLEQARSLYH